MKKYSIYALMGAIALAGSVGFSSCSSSSDDIIDNPDYIPEDNAVKTQFAISLPSNVNASITRMSDAKVQQADNTFRGMQDIVIIPFVKISDRWLTRYFTAKAKRLQEALETETLPPICSARERWHNRKCLDYCDARQHCPYAQEIKIVQLFKAG